MFVRSSLTLGVFFRRHRTGTSSILPIEQTKDEDEEDRGCRAGGNRPNDIDVRAAPMLYHRSLRGCHSSHGGGGSRRGGSEW